MSFYLCYLNKYYKNNHVCRSTSNVYIWHVNLTILSYFIFFCLETCSWRADSKRCYPGTCSKEIATSCKCLDGFGGPDHNCDHSKYI